jgi:hypothetical protein
MAATMRNAGGGGSASADGDGGTNGAACGGVHGVRQSMSVCVERSRGSGDAGVSGHRAGRKRVAVNGVLASMATALSLNVATIEGKKAALCRDSAAPALSSAANGSCSDEANAPGSDKSTSRCEGSAAGAPESSGAVSSMLIDMSTLVLLESFMEVRAITLALA